MRDVCRAERRNSLKILRLFLIPAIICALPAEKIDKAVSTDKKLKKSIRKLENKKGDQL